MTVLSRSRLVLHKFYALSWSDRVLLLEAAAVLAVASLTIVLVPFRWIARIAVWKTRLPTPDAEARNILIKRVRWATLVCARHVPWKAVCFQQGLAAQFMLRRRGIPSVLYYGAAPDCERGLAAHVWIRDGDVDVIGGDVAHRFAVLATFPTTPLS